MCVNNHCFALGSEVAAICCPSSSSTSAHVHLDMVQSTRECFHESGAPHIPHALESNMCLCDLTLLVGIECYDKRHRNILTFPGTAVFPNDFHSFSSAALLEDWPRTLLLFLSMNRFVRAMLYAERTE